MSSTAVPSTSVSNRDALDPELNTLDLFSTLARTGLFLEALQRDCLAPYRLSFAEYSVLRLLQRAPRRRLSPTLLAEQIVCTTGAMTKLADRLERAGHITRDRDPKDRRSVLVCLTPQGSKTATAASRTYKRVRKKILSQLDESESLRIHRGLLNLLALLETDRSDR